MKNSKRYAVISLIMFFMMIVGLSSNVNATSAGLILSTPTPGPNGTTSVTPSPNPTTTVSPTPNPTTTITVTPTPRPTNNITNNTTNTNNINNDISKDLPQTGENDIYIVSAIGVVALVIGGIAYMKSRKYDM